TTNTIYASVVNQMVDPLGGTTNIMDDTITVTFPGPETLYMRDIGVGPLGNSAPPPTAGNSAVYTAPLPLLSMEISTDGINFTPSTGTGQFMVRIDNTNPPSGSTVVFNTEVTQFDFLMTFNGHPPLVVRLTPSL